MTRPRPPVRLTEKERLNRIAQILESVDCRCAAADGPVTPTRHEITDAELHSIYVLSATRYVLFATRGVAACGRRLPARAKP